MPIDRSTPPAASSARPYAFPAFSRHRLSNGLQVFVARRHGVPLAGIDLLLPAGSQLDPGRRSGLAAFTAALLDEGTASRTSTEIADAVERLGGRLASGGDWDVAFLSLNVLSTGLDEGLETFFDVATGPTFPAGEIERLRRERLDEIRRRRDDPAVLASEALQRVLYQGTVYGSPLIGSEGSLESLSRGDFVEFYRRHMSAFGASHLIAVGDLDPDSLMREIERRLPPSRAPESPPRQPSIHPAARDHVTVTLVDRPQAAQTELRLGHVGVSRSHPGRAARVVMNALLGGKFTSRVNLNLRERHGYTYGAHSRFVDRLGPGPFVVSTAVANDVAGAACGEVISELERLREEPVTAAELTDTRSYLLGVFPYGLQTHGGVSSRLETLAVYDLPDDYFTTYLAELAGVEADDVLATARASLHPESLAIVAVGPASSLEPQLAPFGELEVTTPAPVDEA